jgi:hypothetical protein
MKYISITTITLTAILLATDSLAQANPELDRLRATYAGDLEKLYQRCSEAGRRDDATEVLAELKTMGVAVVNIPRRFSEQFLVDVALDTTAEAEVSRPISEQFFVDTAWKTPSGTIFVFEENGRASRSYNNANKTSLTWKIHPTFMVDLTGPPSPGRAPVTWFFCFDSKTEAFYGTSKDDVAHKLQREK